MSLGEEFCKNCDRDEQYFFYFSHVSQFLRLQCQKGPLGSPNLGASFINRISPSNFYVNSAIFCLRRCILLAASCILMIIYLNILHPALKSALFRGGKSALFFLSEQNKFYSVSHFSPFSVTRNFCVATQGISGNILNCW